MAAAFDVQGVQSRTFAERGGARYLVELAAAIEHWFPTAIDRYLINPDLPVARGLDVLPAPHRIATLDEIPGSSRVYHIGSVFEPDVSIDALWPRAARSLPLVVTLYDLIPALFP